LQITLNGERRDVPDHLTIEGLILHLSLAPERLAVERNRQVVRRAEWPRVSLEEQDRIEIIHFVGGGDENAVITLTASNIKKEKRNNYVYFD
jgi:thiamine biosynthesis protein ThiS